MGRYSKTIYLFLLVVFFFSSPQDLFSQQFNKASGIKTAIDVQSRHAQNLMVHDNIVGTGIGLAEDGIPVIVVYTLTDKDRGIPDKIEGVPVVIEVTGMFVARSDPTARFTRPVPIGVSTGHPDITAGTIGCRVTDGANIYALSNNHVYANQNDASIGDSGLQPGPYDGGTDTEDRIGGLFEYEPIIFNDSSAKNLMDAAIITVDYKDFSGDGNEVFSVSTTTPPDGYGIPSSSVYGDEAGDGFFDDIEKLLELGVQKFGRTTKLTKGNISEVNVTVDVCFDARGFACFKWARFVDQLAITPGDFSSGGDSGSLIVTDDDNKNPVGLLFAGSSTRTIANRIDLVLDRFDVSVDDSETDAGTEEGSTTEEDDTNDTGVVDVESIVPDSMKAGNTIDVTIYGSGFAEGAEVKFENGSGPTPTTSNVKVIDSDTIEATVTAKSGGPPRDRVWDVRITNTDGSSGVLVEGFTVTP